ncbi:response regulator transcription factor [Pseudodonghicola flavimaris]|uniref:Response regulator n=1 Tax=Pseudodonghicola flavimaris TaxID=3050036 RepID=A0ABT7EWM1_9RHOB|nr:response regulator [Pseudodonghicola flavimaris]MDK3016742.1 response regulator [Pseudodonghicola flavimaris]
MKILAVDDDELIRELLLATLEAHGYSDVVLAESGEDALRKIASAGVPFDAFMFDIQMPGMDGIELTRRVRDMEIYRSAPVVMITAMNQKDYIDRAFLAGATDYVTKPFDTTELMTRIRLADRLQAETRRAAAALAPRPEKPQAAFTHPITIEEIKGYVSNGVLKNYVMIMKEQKQFAIGAFAIRVPELEQVHAGSTAEEFAYVVTDVAEVISDVLVGSQAFVTYIGDGVFLCVGPKRSLPQMETVQDQLISMLNDPDLVYCDEVPTSFSAQVGAVAAPKLLERRDDLRFLDRAVDNLKQGARIEAPAPARSAGGFMAVHAA